MCQVLEKNISVLVVLYIMLEQSSTFVPLLYWGVKLCGKDTQVNSAFSIR